MMTLKQHVDAWLETADESIQTMRVLLKGKRYKEAMYFGHLAIEKMFKAVLACQDKRIKYTHNLVKLAGLCDMVLTDDLLAELDDINKFNTAGKYTKKKTLIYKQCQDSKYRTKWVGIINKWYKELRKQVIALRGELPDRTPASYPEDFN
jgi:HEPN domain-containing protein